MNTSGAIATIEQSGLFPSQAKVNGVQAENIAISSIAKSEDPADAVLQIEVKPDGNPVLCFSAGDTPWNWHGYGTMIVTLTNLNDAPVFWGIRLDDDPTTFDPSFFAANWTTIGPKQTRSFAIPIGSQTPLEKGMRGGPPIGDCLTPEFTSMKSFDERHIYKAHFFFLRPRVVQKFLIGKISLAPPVSYDAIVDAFGQYTRAVWPGKILDEGELIRRRDAETLELKAYPALPGRDEYGGWAVGPQLKATGFFHTTQRDGKWWFVTPAGHYYLSFGVNSVSPSSHEGYTLVEGREKMFSWLPQPSDPLAKHYGNTGNVLYGPIKSGKTFSFYSANIERKYGPQCLDRARQVSLERLRAWGFTTIANWSDPELYKYKILPYTVGMGITGDFARVSNGVDYWGKMVDPFDPAFAAGARKSIAITARQFRDDPWLLGYFIDNELSWGEGGNESPDAKHFGLVFGALNETGRSPAKQAFIEQLRQKYREVEQLNKAWGMSFESWEILLGQPQRPTIALTASAREDFSLFLKAFALRYFRTIAEILKESDPNHLYLGCRFAGSTPEAREAAAQYCDVVSFNSYERLIDPLQWDFVKVLRKPCLMGEFHFGAIDRGMFHPGLKSAIDQRERAQLYTEYLRSLIDNPYFIGTAWFEYMDEPLTGRTFDGENYSIGLVSVTDTPYPELAAASRKVYGEAYRRRSRADSKEPLLS